MIFFRRRWVVFFIGCFSFAAISGCDFFYRILQKEGAEEKEILGDVVAVQSNEQVKKVQTFLKLYGYSVGNPDGTLGNNTRVALGKFQQDNGLKPTRFVDYETWGRLKFHEDIGLIKDGKIHIAAVQTALEAAGFDPGKIDGYAGPKTWSAVKAFQKSKGLNADGRIGLKTMKFLAEYLQ